MSNYTGTFTPNDINNPWTKAFNMIDAGSKVLDVGCSLGRFGEALIGLKQCVVDGIEPDKGDAKLASQKLRKVVNSFMEEAFSSDLKNEKYDYIVFLDVIEHLVDPVSSLKMLKSHLKPNGKIIFSIPNMAHASVRIMVLDGKIEYGDTGLLDNTHLHFYNRNEITRVFSDAGYKFLSWDYTQVDFPEELLVSELKNIGIYDPSQDLLHKLKSEEARIFQYIGEATIGSGVKSKKQKHYVPDPQGTITQWYQDREKYNQEVMNSKIDTLETEIKNLNSQYLELINSKAYRMSKKIKRIRDVVKRPK